MPVSPFTIDIPQADIDDLRRRLAATRWPEAVTDDWSQGTPQPVLRRLVEHWGGAFDWRAVEGRLNALDHVLVDVGGQRVHAVRAGTRGATPLLLVHGWPDGFLRFEKALPLLADRFDIVVPSVPGYGFSEIPARALGPAKTAELFAALMTELGHERFGVHGADIGATIVEQLALQQPERVLGLHLGDVPLRRLRALPAGERTEAEHRLARDLQEWDAAEGAYAHQQRTKPQTLAAALDDSPAGLASWILEKFFAWSDNDGDVFAVFTPDELAANLSIYWFTRTAGSAGRYYYDAGRADLDDAYVDTPTGVASFPHDLLPAPRESAERWYRIERWSTLQRGGHFGPWEQPELWAGELRAFFDQLGA